MPDSSPNWRDSLSTFRKSGAIPDAPAIKIAHISDLHFINLKLPNWCKTQLRNRGIGDHNKDALFALSSKVAQLAPDIVVASGDLATLGDRVSAVAASEFLWELTQTRCNLPKESLIVIPGNHDSLLKYLRIKRSRAYDSVIGPVPILRELDIRGFPVLIFSFDSSIERSGEWWPFRASKGKVRPERFIEFNDQIFALRQRDPERFDKALKIAVVHHHPLPVPNKDLESFTVMQNGGTFIAHMQSNNINLVLHGHEHFPYSCSYRYDQTTDWSVVVSAGSASQWGKAVNSFSFLEFYPWQRLNLRQFDYYSDAGFSENFNGGRTFWFERP